MTTIPEDLPPAPTIAGRRQPPTNAAAGKKVGPAQPKPKLAQPPPLEPDNSSHQKKTQLKAATLPRPPPLSPAAHQTGVSTQAQKSGEKPQTGAKSLINRFEQNAPAKSAGPTPTHKPKGVTTMRTISAPAGHIQQGTRMLPVKPPAARLQPRDFPSSQPTQDDIYEEPTPGYEETAQTYEPLRLTGDEPSENYEEPVTEMMYEEPVPPPALKPRMRYESDPGPPRAAWTLPATFRHQPAFEAQTDDNDVPLAPAPPVPMEDAVFNGTSPLCSFA